MIARAVALATALLLAASGPTRAHDAVEGAGPLINGILHPLIVPAHLLILLGLALWIGGQAARTLRLSIVAFAIALMGGLIAARIGPLPPAVLAGAALVAGMLAASAWHPPAWFAAILAAGAGGLIGLDSGGGDAVLAAGIWLGAHLIVLNIVNLAMRAEAAWLRIGMRVIGAWSAAIALLMLALDLKA